MRHVISSSFAVLATAFALSTLTACGPECGGGSLNLTLTNHSSNFSGSVDPYQPGRVTATMGAGGGELTINSRLCAMDGEDNRTLTLVARACGGPGQPCCNTSTCSMGLQCITPSGGSTPLCLNPDPMVHNALGSSCDPTMGMCPTMSTCTYGFCIAGEESTIRAGGVYALRNSTEDTASHGAYSETNTGNWHTLGGWLQVESIDGNNISFRVNSVLFIADDGSTTAAGTFTFDGTGRVQNVSGL